MAIDIYDSCSTDIKMLSMGIKNIARDKVLIKNMPDSFSKSLNSWISVINKRLEEPFTLVVLGDFKRGKSTIINAILGTELAPVNVSPETYTINEISYGEQTKCSAVLTNGRIVDIELEDIVRENMDELSQKLPAPIEYIDIKYNSEILKELRIVDTPGLSDLDELDDRVANYLINADAIIYVASALLPISESEQLFISSHVQPQRFGVLYILVNMLDALNSQRDIDRILNRVSTIADSLVPNTAIYGISGNDELARKNNAPRPIDKGTREFYETQFFKFELSLKRDIIMKKDIIRSKRVLNLQSSAISDILTQIRMFTEVWAYDELKLKKISEDFESKCKAIRKALDDAKPKLELSLTEMEQQAQVWMYEFFSYLRENVLECRPKVDEEQMPAIQGFTANDVEKYFYSYLMEKIGEAYRKCIETHKDRINELVDAMSKNIAKQLGIEELSEVSQNACVERIMNRFKNTVTKTVMDMTMLGSNENFPNTTMGDFKKIMKRKKKTDIIDTALENFDSIRTNTLKDIKSAYRVLKTNAFDRLEEIFNAQVEAGREALEIAKGMDKGVKSEEFSISLEKVTYQLKNFQKIIAKYI